MVAGFHLFMNNNYILINICNILLKTIYILKFFGNQRKKKILIRKRHLLPCSRNQLMWISSHLLMPYVSFKF